MTDSAWQGTSIQGWGLHLFGPGRRVEPREGNTFGKIKNNNNNTALIITAQTTLSQSEDDDEDRNWTVSMEQRNQSFTHRHSPILC